MPESGIFFEKNFIPWSALNSYDGNDPVLLFCRDWLKGKQEFIRFSSGSTGAPKAIRIQREQMVYSALATSKVLKPLPSDQILLNLNPETIGGTMSLVRAMEWKLNIHVVPAEGNPMLHLDPNHPLSICSLVPLQLFDIFRDPPSVHKLNRFRMILLGGAAVDKEMEDAIIELKPRVYHSYGMTETCSHIALRLLNTPGKQERFYPLEGVKIRLSDEQTLLINAPMAIHPDLKTKDLARIYDDQSFEIIGRLDRTIISGGIKIHVEELERLFSPLLNPYPYFLFGTKDVRLGQKLMLIIESEPFPTAELEKMLKAVAPPYKMPKEIIFAPRFERTLSGKIDRINTIKKWVKTN